MKRTKASILDIQINQLIAQTTQEDWDLVGTIKAIAPVLKTIALEQEYTEYFVQQNEHGFALDRVQKISDPAVTVDMIFVYSKKAIAHQNCNGDSSLRVVKWEIIPLLFNFLGINDVHSLVFDQNFAKKVERQTLYELCQHNLRISRIA